MFYSLAMFLGPWTALATIRYHTSSPFGTGAAIGGCLTLCLLLLWLVLSRFVCTIASQVDLTSPTLVEPTKSPKTQRMEVRCGLCEYLWT